MNAYLAVSGVIVAVEVLAVAGTVLLVIAASRSARKQDQAARDIDQAVAMVRSRWHEEDHIGDEAEAWLRDGGLSG